jgi:polysaccharide export outer membrane protein
MQGQAPQQPSAPLQPPQRLNPPSILISPEQDYRIGSRDVIEIQVEDAPELSVTRDISSAGTFLMPYLGRMLAKGKTPEQLAREIADGLRDKYLKDPRVNVLVKAYNSRSFLIMGAVRNPGVYQIESQADMFELIVLAGGLVEPHGAFAFVIRKIKQEEGEESQQVAAASEEQTKPGELSSPVGVKYEMIKVNITGLLKGHFEQNRTILPGDVVHVPPSDTFFIAGEVNAPGQFALKEGTTLTQAISLARGFKYEAAKNRGIIFRENEKTGERDMMKVDLGAVMDGKSPDMKIQANDIIMVPGSKWKAISGAMLRGLGMNTITRGIPLP